MNVGGARGEREEIEIAVANHLGAVPQLHLEDLLVERLQFRERVGELAGETKHRGAALVHGLGADLNGVVETHDDVGIDVTEAKQKVNCVSTAM